MRPLVRHVIQQIAPKHHILSMTQIIKDKVFRVCLELHRLEMEMFGHMESQLQ